MASVFNYQPLDIIPLAMAQEDSNPELDQEALDADKPVSQIQKAVEEVQKPWKQPLQTDAILETASKNTKFSMVAAKKQGGVTSHAFHCIRQVFRELKRKEKEEQYTFEIASWWRQGKDDFHPIFQHENGATLYLGAQPNGNSFRKGPDGRMISDGENLFNKGIRHVISINKTWERTARGCSFPYQAADWRANDMTYMEIEAADHAPLSLVDLHKCADSNHCALEKGNSTYNHCRVGSGRSAMSVAAYLIKYRGFTPAEARDYIQGIRSKSTISKRDKMERLNEFYLDCHAPK